MKKSESFKIIGVSILVIAGLAACNKPGPAERAGENIDRSVDQLGQKMSKQGEKAGTAIEDTEITAKVKAAIFAESGLKTLQISVDTINGVVTLTGSVNSQANSTTAESLARAVSGVKSVDNRLVHK